MSVGALNVCVTHHILHSLDVQIKIYGLTPRYFHSNHSYTNTLQLEHKNFDKILMNGSGHGDGISISIRPNFEHSQKLELIKSPSVQTLSKKMPDLRRKFITQGYKRRRSKVIIPLHLLNQRQLTI